MASNDLLFYALNDGSLKKAIIDLLAVKWPLPISEIHREVCKGKTRSVTYQAVRKAIKQLQEDGCLCILEKNKYQVNLEWIKDLGNKIKQVEANYQGKFVFQKTVFEKEGSKINFLVARDGIVRDTLREEKLNQVLRELIPIFRDEFGPHNIFNKDEDFIINYLMGVQKQNEIMIFLNQDTVIGGTVFEKKDESVKEDHSIWKLKHFALNKGYAEDSGKAIMDEIEDRLKKKSKSLKVQVNLSENEARAIKFFEKHGFTKEGTLKDHYRVGEDMYIYSKHFSR